MNPFSGLPELLQISYPLLPLIFPAWILAAPRAGAYAPSALGTNYQADGYSNKFRAVVGAMARGAFLSSAVFAAVRYILLASAREIGPALTMYRTLRMSGTLMFFTSLHRVPRTMANDGKEQWSKACLGRSWNEFWRKCRF